MDKRYLLGTIYQTAPFLILASLYLTGCALETKKEWNDKYDPSQWRKQFNVCKDIFYSNLSEEIKRDEWSKCMDKDYAETD